MKKSPSLAFLLAALFLGGLPGRAAGIADADAKFDKGLYQDALKEYEPFLKNPSDELRFKALYRAAESEALLFRYTEAAQRAFDAELPADPVWKARFLILRAELAREFLKQYGNASPRDVEEGQKDLTRRTPEQWREQTRAAYLQLWDLRQKLVDVPLKGESYFVDFSTSELAATPSLWDFAVLRWSGYLLEEEAAFTGAKPAALSVLGQEYAVGLSSTSSPAVQAAALYEDAAGLAGHGRGAARELWRLKRLQLAIDHGDFFEPAQDHKAFVDAAIARLKNWEASNRTPLGRAEVGLAAAQLLNEEGRFAETVALCQKIEKDFPRPARG